MDIKRRVSEYRLAQRERAVVLILLVGVVVFGVALAPQAASMTTTTDRTATGSLSFGVGASASTVPNSTEFYFVEVSNSKIEKRYEANDTVKTDYTPGGDIYGFFPGENGDYLFVLDPNGVLIKVHQSNMTEASRNNYGADGNEMQLYGDDIYVINDTALMRFDYNLNVGAVNSSYSGEGDGVVWGGELYWANGNKIVGFYPSNLTSFAQTSSTYRNLIAVPWGPVQVTGNAPSTANFYYRNLSVNYTSQFGPSADSGPGTDNEIAYHDNGYLVSALYNGTNNTWTTARMSLPDTNVVRRVEVDPSTVFVVNSKTYVSDYTNIYLFGTGFSQSKAQAKRGAGEWFTGYATNITISSGGGGGKVNESLEIDTRHYLNHNTTTPFRVYYTKNNSTTINVTSNATVTVRDPNVVSVDQNAGTITSTNNTSINKVTFVNASYAGANQSKEVVVANETVENIDILPPLQKWTATIGDDNSLVIVIATAIAAGVAFIASSLAGVAAFPVIITGAWVAGYVATHTLLAAILMSIFVGLNVAQVVEYSGS